MNSDLCDLTVLELTTLYQAGTVSPVDVMQQVLTRIIIQLSRRVQSGIPQRAHHRVQIDRVAHHAMSDDQIARPCLAVAEHDDFVVH